MEKVLLVDDEIDICLLLSGILQREGFKTAYALTLKEATNKLLSDRYEVVFLDLNLPDGVGYQLIPLIRENPQTKIIVVSAYDSEKTKAREEGADYFIPKPFNRNNVLIALRQLEMNNT